MHHLKTIKTGLLRFSPEIGILILFSSFFTNWFSCDIFGSQSKNIGYVELNSHFYSVCLAFYLSSLVLAVHFFKKSHFRENSLLISFLLLPSLLFLLYLIVVTAYMNDVGIHMTHDFPCNSEPGVWLHILGLIVTVLGNYFRFRAFGAKA